MADDEAENRGGAPLPPKRPTIIRGPSKAANLPSGQNGASVRPAAAPGTSPRPARPAPCRPPSPMGRSTPVAKPEPLKSSANVHESVTSSSNSSSKGKSGSVKKKIEITIVDARPMSEVGFRDTQNAVAQSPDSSNAPSLPSSPPAVSPRPQTDQSSLSCQNGKPQPKGRPQRPASIAAMPSPLPPHRPDEHVSPPPMLSPVTISDKNIQDCGLPTPPKPKRPTIIRPASMLQRHVDCSAQDDQHIEKSIDSAQTTGVLPTTSSRASVIFPPARSRPPEPASIRAGPTTIGSTGGAGIQDEEEKDVLNNKHVDQGRSKPLRATIIRPLSRQTAVSSEDHDDYTNTSTRVPPLPSRPPSKPLILSHPSKDASAPPTQPPPPLPSVRPLPSPKPRPRNSELSVSNFQDLKDVPKDIKISPIPSPRPSPRTHTELTPRSITPSSPSSSSSSSSSVFNSSPRRETLPSSSQDFTPSSSSIRPSPLETPRQQTSEPSQRAPRQQACPGSDPPPRPQRPVSTAGADSAKLPRRPPLTNKSFSDISDDIRDFDNDDYATIGDCLRKTKGSGSSLNAVRGENVEDFSNSLSSDRPDASSGHSESNLSIVSLDTDPVYAVINKTTRTPSILKARLAQFETKTDEKSEANQQHTVQVKLHSTEPAESSNKSHDPDISSSNTHDLIKKENDQISMCEDLVEKMGKSHPAVLPKPKPKLAPKPGPKPKPVPAPVGVSKPSVPATLDNSASRGGGDDGGGGGGKSQSIGVNEQMENDSNALSLRGDGVTLRQKVSTAACDDPEGSNSFRKTEDAEQSWPSPKHLPASFLAKFENKPDADGNSMSQRSSAAPIPRKRPVTIIGGTSKQSLKGGRDEEKDAGKEADVVMNKVTKAETEIEQPLVAPRLPSRRPVTIIGFPQKSETKLQSVDNSEDPDHLIGNDRVQNSFEQKEDRNPPKRPSVTNGQPAPPTPLRAPSGTHLRHQVFHTQPVLTQTLVANSQNESLAAGKGSIEDSSHGPPPPRRAGPPARPPPAVHPERPPASSIETISPSNPPARPAPARPPWKPFSEPQGGPQSSSGDTEQGGPSVKPRAMGTGESAQYSGAPHEEPQDQPVPSEPPESSRTRPPSSGPPPRPPSMGPPKRPPSVTPSFRKSSLADENNESERQQPARPATEPLPRRRATDPPTLPGRPGPGHTLYHYMSGQPHGVALHDFSSDQPNELQLKEGEVVLLVKRVDDQWMQGRVGEREGIFPENFVEIRCPLETEKSTLSTGQDTLNEWPTSPDEGLDVMEKPDTLTGPRCRARFDFEGDGEGELAIEDGDVIQILDHVGSEWMKGKLNGDTGIFPSSFVEIIEDLAPDSISETDLSSTLVTAVFDFEGEDGELSFQAEDKIQILSKVNLDWLYGEVNGKRGQLPASFISHVPQSLPDFVAECKDDSIEALGQDSGISDYTDQSSPQPCVMLCTATHDYQSSTPGDLEFQIGDSIEVLEFVGEEWLYGRLAGREGMFPRNFISLEDEDKSGERKPVEKLLGRAVYSFDGESSTDLSFKEGDVIELEHFVDDTQAWRWGQAHGRRGMFPSAFVEVTPSI